MREYTTFIDIEYRRRTLPLLDDGALDAAEVSCNVADEVLLLGVVEDLLPKGAGLLEVDYRTGKLDEVNESDQRTYVQ